MSAIPSSRFARWISAGCQRCPRPTRRTGARHDHQGGRQPGGVSRGGLAANLAVAEAALAAGARRVGLVSAVGASARSSVFYNRVKGELEDALKAMDLTALVIAQPSLLLDYREGLQQPPRLGETIAIPIAKLLAPLIPGAYRPVQARAVAQALVKTVPSAQGVVVLASDVMAGGAEG